MEVVTQSRFRKDLRTVKNSGRHDINDLLQIVERLSTGVALHPKHLDHPLQGDWVGFRECHIRPDWLLVYRVEPDRLVLVRTGSHAELFG